MAIFRFFSINKNSSVVASSNSIFYFIISIFLSTTFLSANNLDKISKDVLNKFRQKYPCVNAMSPKITPTSKLPLKFNKYAFIGTKLSSNSFRKKSGTFKAMFMTGKKKQKTIYFKFNIDARVVAFKAKHKLYNDKILLRSDYVKIGMKIDKLPSKIITCSIYKTLVTKNYVRKDSILTMNRFKYKKNILRGSSIRAYIEDGGLVLETGATVLRDANIGDIVKIKTDKGRLLKAKIVSIYKAIIVK